MKPTLRPSWEKVEKEIFFLLGKESPLSENQKRMLSKIQNILTNHCHSKSEKTLIEILFWALKFRLFFQQHDERKVNKIRKIFEKTKQRALEDGFSQQDVGNVVQIGVQFSLHSRDRPALLKTLIQRLEATIKKN